MRPKVDVVGGLDPVMMNYEDEVFLDFALDWFREFYPAEEFMIGLFGWYGVFDDQALAARLAVDTLYYFCW